MALYITDESKNLKKVASNIPGKSTKVLVNGKVVETFNADNKADTSYVETNKANKDLSNVTYPTNTIGATETGTADRVIETYISSDGKTWYRKWKSGWKEVGFKIAQGSGDWRTVTLPLSFSNTDYMVVNGAGITTGRYGAYTNSVNSVKIKIEGSTQQFSVYCAGY